MAQENQPDDSPQQTDADVTDSAESESDATDAPPSAPTPAPAAAQPPVAAAPAPSNLADLSAQLREAIALYELAAKGDKDAQYALAHWGVLSNSNVTDVIDLYQIHWPERHVPAFGAMYFDPAKDTEVISVHEQLDTFGDLIKAGKVKTIGLSNETPWGVHEFVRLAEQHGLPRVATVQNPFCLINRTVENGLDETMHRLGVSLLAYSPLGFGLLMLQGISELIKRLAFLQGKGPDVLSSEDAKSDDQKRLEELEAQTARELSGVK